MKITTALFACVTIATAACAQTREPENIGGTYLADVEMRVDADGDGLVDDTQAKPGAEIVVTQVGRGVTFDHLATGEITGGTAGFDAQEERTVLGDGESWYQRRVWTYSGWADKSGAEITIDYREISLDTLTGHSVVVVTYSNMRKVR